MKHTHITLYLTRSSLRLFNQVCISLSLSHTPHTDTDTDTGLGAVPERPKGGAVALAQHYLFTKVSLHGHESGHKTPVRNGRNNTVVTTQRRQQLLLHYY